VWVCEPLNCLCIPVINCVNWILPKLYLDFVNLVILLVSRTVKCVNKQAGSKVYFVTTVMIIKVYNAVMTNASVKLMRGKETMQTDGITL